MVVFHLFIISTFPLAVPLEWNVLFAYATIFLFLGFPAWHGYAVVDMSSPWLTAAIVAGAGVLPDPGQLPARQGVVPAVDAPVRRQLGVGGVGVRAGRRGEAEQGHPLAPRTRSTSSSRSVTNRSGRRSPCSEPIAWRSHAQPGPRPVLGAAEEPARHRRPHRAGGRVRLQLVDRLQLRRRPPAQRGPDRRGAAARRQFEPGELVVVWVESQAWGSKVQHYKVIDAALGVIERGTWKVADAVDEQPWLPNGPIPHRRHLVAAPASASRAPRGTQQVGVSTAIVVGGRAQRPGRRGHPRQGGRAGDRAGGRRRDRRRHPHAARRSCPACCTTTARRSTRWPSGHRS